MFRDDPVVWRTFAFYTAVVVYSLTASLVIGQDEKTSGAVPIVAFVAVLASIVLYRRLTTGAFNSIQLASALAQVARRGREVIDGLYILDASGGDVQDGPARASPPRPPAQPPQEIRWPRASRSSRSSMSRACCARPSRPMRRSISSWDPVRLIAEGAIVAVAAGQTDPELEHVVVNALTVGEERTYRAGSAVCDSGARGHRSAGSVTCRHDPTTAVQALDAMDGLLRALATRELDVGRIADRDGTLRITLVSDLGGLPRRRARRDHRAARDLAERLASDPAAARRARSDHATHKAPRTRRSPPTKSKTPTATAGRPLRLTTDSPRAPRRRAQKHSPAQEPIPGHDMPPSGQRRERPSAAHCCDADGRGPLRSPVAGLTRCLAGPRSRG